jgi:hypothetical protein
MNAPYVIEGVGKHRGDLVEFRGCQLEIEMGIAQRLARVLKWSAGDRAEP